MFEYGKMLLLGNGVAKDMNKAILYIKKSADRGNVNAMLGYATLRLKGDKIPKDKKEAIKYLKNASNHGSSEASGLLMLVNLGGADSSDDYDDQIFESNSDEYDEIDINCESFLHTTQFSIYH